LRSRGLRTSAIGKRFTLRAGITVTNARRALALTFADAGIDSPALDARLLVGHALGLDHAGLVEAADRLLREAEIRTIEGVAVRRLADEPVARILGVKEFWGLPIRLTESVLVPRPDTETVVEAALDALDRDGPRTRPLRIADLGTGSGALLIALLSELPQAFGVGTDVSREALAVARANADVLGLARRAAFVVCDFGAALAGGFDLVVSNPPYIKSADIATLAPDVRDHDPRLALDGGPDGLAAYRTIAADARRLLAPDGHLVVELGAGAAAAVSQTLMTAGLAEAGPPVCDLAGIPRALHAKRPE
jgi:release factor glutamine methyltransferase